LNLATWLFLIAILAAALGLAWKRLNRARKSAIIGAVSRSAVRVRDHARALQERLQRKQSAFRALFLTQTGELSPAGAIVMAHMARFCYAFATTAAGKADRDELMRREGRRQAYLEMLRMTSTDPLEVFSAAQRDEVVLG
jgi:hypothetical protein